MKGPLILFLTAATVTLGVVCAVQTHKSNVRTAELALRQGELQEKAQRIEAMQAAQESYEQRREELTAQAHQLTVQVQALRRAQTSPASAMTASVPIAESEQPQNVTKGVFGNMFSKMMQDPDGRQLVRATQGIMTDQLYGPLISKMGLAPEEAAKFKDLLTDNMMNAADKVSSAFGGLGSTNGTQMFAHIAGDQKALDDQVRALLGDARYGQYKDYQETAAQRMQLNAFKQQAGSDYNLNDQQTEALLAIMKEEQKNVAASTGMPMGNADSDPAKLQTLLTGNKMDELLQTQQTVGQQVFERARSILSPDQLAAFGRFQTNQTQMMRLGMNMARSMFTPDPPATETAPPN
jgi:hypothetical protein